MIEPFLPMLATSSPRLAEDDLAHSRNGVEARGHLRPTAFPVKGRRLCVPLEVL
jgi:hypothetical protein